MSLKDSIVVFLGVVGKTTAITFPALTEYFPPKVLEEFLEGISRLNEYFLITEKIDIGESMPEKLKQRCLECDKESCTMKKLIQKEIDARNLKTERKVKMDFFWDEEDE